MSKYARPANGGGVTGSEDLYALTEQEAYEWLEANQEIDAIIEHLGEAWLQEA